MLYQLVEASDEPAQRRQACFVAQIKSLRLVHQLGQTWSAAWKGMKGMIVLSVHLSYYVD